MPNVLPELLSQLKEDSIKYILFRDKELYVPEPLEFIQNESKGSIIRVLLPKKIREVNILNLRIRIDYIDPRGRFGTIISNQYPSYKTFYTDPETKEYKKISNNTKIKYEDGKLITTDENQYQIIDNYTYLDKETNIYYYIKVDTEPLNEKEGLYSNTSLPLYNSNIVNGNYEDSANVSADYESAYADCSYTKLLAYNNFEIKSEEYVEGNNTIQYYYFDWIISDNITTFPGILTFSISLSDSDVNSLYWKSDKATLLIKENLSNSYNLHAELEENYLVQGREIIPVGNYKNILIKGDTNSNKIFYKINRYFQGQDLLNRRKININGTSYPVYRQREYLSSNVYYIKQDNSIKLLSTQYQINSIILEDLNGNQYNLDNNKIIIQSENEELILSDFKCSSIFTSNNTKEYKITYMLNGKEETQNSITEAWSINNIEYIPHVNITANGFQIDTRTNDIPIYTEKDLIPMFNRNIRFNYSTPDGYGSYTNGEIEYINEEENYFIFSWTPNYEVTRTAGEVNYSIEFFINSLNNIIDANGNTIQEKSYSWSTKNSTITVEENLATTVSADYIPSWVRYIENYFSEDFNNYKLTTIQPQIQAIEDLLTEKVFTNFQQISVKAINDEFIIGEPFNVSYNKNTIKDVLHLEKTSSIDYLYYGAQIIGTENKFAYIYYNEFNQILTLYFDQTQETPIVPNLEEKTNIILSAFYDDPISKKITNNQLIEYLNKNEIGEITEGTIETAISNFLSRVKEYFGLDNINNEESLSSQFKDKLNNLINYIQNTFVTTENIIYYTYGAASPITISYTNTTITLDGIEYSIKYNFIESKAILTNNTTTLEIKIFDTIDAATSIENLNLDNRYTIYIQSVKDDFDNTKNELITKVDNSLIDLDNKMNIAATTAVNTNMSKIVNNVLENGDLEYFKGKEDSKAYSDLYTNIITRLNPALDNMLNDRYNELSNTIEKYNNMIKQAPSIEYIDGTLIITKAITE